MGLSTLLRRESDEEREIRERKESVQRIRDEREAREEAFRKGEEEHQAAFSRQIATAQRQPAVPAGVPRNVGMGTGARWAEAERLAREAEQRAREHSERHREAEQAKLQREHDAQAAWARQRDELTAKLREAQAAVQRAETDLGQAVLLADVDAAGGAKSTLLGAEAIRDAAQEAVDFHQRIQPGFGTSRR